jgi:hypothetical protein
VYYLADPWYNRTTQLVLLCDYLLHRCTDSYTVMLNQRKALSEWCRFHGHYCRQVETWDREFCTTTRGRKRISLLYLGNDIMQNTRKESGGYISEFKKVVPAAMNEVLKKADDSAQNRFLICSLIFVVLFIPHNKFVHKYFGVTFCGYFTGRARSLDC